MKREHMVKPVPSSPANQFKNALEKPLVKEFMNNLASNNEGYNRVRTSAAVIGLAISMSATGVLFPQRNNQAFAADSAQAEPSVTIPPAALETPIHVNASVESATTSQPASKVVLATPVIKHEIEQGDTLWSLSQNYQVEPKAIASSNNIDTNTTLTVGKSLKIPPAESSETQAQEDKNLVVRANSPSSEISTPSELAQNNTNPIVIPVIPPQISASTASEKSEAENTLSSQLQTSSPEIAASHTTEKREVQETPTVAIPVPGGLRTEATLSSQLPTPEIASSPAQEAEGTPSIAIPVPENPVTARVRPQTLSVPASPTTEAASSSTPQKEDEKQTAVPIEIPVLFPETAVTPTTEKQTQAEVIVANPIAEPLPLPQPIASRPITVAAQRTSVHRVQPGDTLDAIARRYGISRTELMRLNNLGDPNLIKIDQQLTIPGQNTATLPSAPLPTRSQPVSATATANAPQIRVNAQEASPRERSMEQLRSEVQQLQQNNREVEIARTEIPIPVSSVAEQPRNPEWKGTQTQVANVVEQVIEIPIEPWQPPVPVASPASRQTAPTARPSAELVAAAPIQVEAYNPMLNPSSGQTVSPQLPALGSPENYLPDAPAGFNGYIWPAKGVFTSGYGRRWGRMHRGVDIAGPVGTPIVAAAPGEVITSGWNSGGYGNLVRIRHDNGAVTLYAHNNRNLVRQGQRVEQGEQIAEMGSTGFSTGPHLHFEIHPNGNGAVNPVALLPGNRPAR